MSKYDQLGWISICGNHVYEWLGNCKISLDPSQSRWGFMQAMGTFIIGGIAITISLFALFISIRTEGTGMTCWDWVVAVLAALCGLCVIGGIVLSFCVFRYFIDTASQPSKDDIQHAMNERPTDPTLRELKSISTSLNSMSKSLNMRLENIDNSLKGSSANTRKKKEQ